MGHPAISPDRAASHETASKQSTSSPRSGLSKKRSPPAEADSCGDLIETGGGSDLPSPKRIKAGGSPAANSALGTEEGELKSPNSPQSTESAPPQATRVEASPRAHSGWNAGVSNGLRTSFARKDRFTKPSLQRVSEAPVQLDDWTLPPLPSPSHFDVEHKDQESWEKMFVEWCRSLVELNKTKIKADTARDRNRVAQYYHRWIGMVDGLSKSKAGTARRTATQFTQKQGAQLEAIFSDTLPLGNVVGEASSQAGSPHGGYMESQEKPITPDAVAAEYREKQPTPNDELDTEYREKYFPGIGPGQVFCHLCASHGHDSAGCSEMTCRFCRDPGHPSFSCPTRRRCTKCKGLGHSEGDCREKLKLAPGEIECAFCGSRDHEDSSCPQLWRSFTFNPNNVRKVRSLPIFCYWCGSEGHYGACCGLDPQEAKKRSQPYLDQYVDPASSEVAIAFSTSHGDVLQVGLGWRPDVGESIVPKRHRFFVELTDDEDDEEEAANFIRPPVQKPPRFGNITFGGNRRVANQNRGGRRQFSNNSNGRSSYNR
ncbi:hypothetical protein VTK56DRAFT_3721 [Thermocarpiscus australiensis]